MHPRRLIRLNELIQQKVSELMLTLKDPEIGFVTITGAELANDVATAKIFYSVLGTAHDREKTAAGLERAKAYIRSEVGRLENLRRVPQIIFIYDESVERADRVSRIISSLHDEGPEKQ